MWIEFWEKVFVVLVILVDVEEILLICEVVVEFWI